MHVGAVGQHSSHLGAPGVRSAHWEGRAGLETGATYGLHILANVTDTRERRGYQAAHVLGHASAAGKGSGANYEVVTKGQSTSFIRSAPFANDSMEWKHATKRLPPSGAHVTQRTHHSADAMTRDEFQATLHCKHRRPAPQESPQLDALRSRVSEQLQANGTASVASLARQFRLQDSSRDFQLSFNEFAKGLLNEGYATSIDECRRLFRVFDSDCSGNVDYRQVLVTCCGALPDRRRQLVINVFRSLNPAGTGCVRLADLMRFDARAHPAVRTGQRSAEDVQQEFLHFFDDSAHCKNGGDRQVTFAEFELFYAATSAITEDEKQFDSVVLDVWQLPGDLFA